MLVRSCGSVWVVLDFGENLTDLRRYFFLVFMRALQRVIFPGAILFTFLCLFIELLPNASPVLVKSSFAIIVLDTGILSSLPDVRIPAGAALLIAMFTCTEHLLLLSSYTGCINRDRRGGGGCVVVEFIMLMFWFGAFVVTEDCMICLSKSCLCEGWPLVRMTYCSSRWLIPMIKKAIRSSLRNKSGGAKEKDAETRQLYG